MPLREEEGSAGSAVAVLRDGPRLPASSHELPIGMDHLDGIRLPCKLFPAIQPRPLPGGGLVLGRQQHFPGSGTD